LPFFSEEKEYRYFFVYCDFTRKSGKVFFAIYRDPSKIFFEPDPANNRKKYADNTAYCNVSYKMLPKINSAVTNHGANYQEKD
jgi:hypothetical protein